MFYLTKFTPHTEMQHHNLLQLVKLEHFVPCSETETPSICMHIKILHRYGQITLTFICAYIPIIIMIIIVMSQNVKKLCFVW